MSELKPILVVLGVLCIVSAVVWYWIEVFSVHSSKREGVRSSGFDTLVKVTTVLANVAVLLTLVALVLEIRGNTKAQLAASRQLLAERAERLLLAQARDLEFAELHRRATIGEPLSEAESVQYIFYFAVAMRIAEAAYLQHRDGLLPEEYWRGRANNLIYRMRIPILREKWRVWRDQSMFNPQFTKWLDEQLSMGSVTGFDDSAPGFERHR